MSLRHILNDDPPPMRMAQPSPRGYPSQPIGSAPQVMSSPPHASGPRSPPSHHPYDDRHRSPPPRPSRSYDYHNSPTQEGPWDPYSRDWSPGEHRYSQNNVGKFHVENDPPQYAQTRSRRGSESEHAYPGDIQVTPKKRRRAGDEEAEYYSSGQGHAHRRHSKGSYPQPLERERENVRLQLDRRVPSPRLDDYEDIWLEDRGQYIMETKMREKQVERFFEDSVLQRNRQTADSMARHYTDRIARIPRLPTPPLPPPPAEQDVMRQRRGVSLPYSEVPDHVDYSMDPADIPEPPLPPLGPPLNVVDDGGPALEGSVSRRGSPPPPSEPAPKKRRGGKRSSAVTVQDDDKATPDSITIEDPSKPAAKGNRKGGRKRKRPASPTPPPPDATFYSQGFNANTGEDIPGASAPYPPLPPPQESPPPAMSAYKKRKLEKAARREREKEMEQRKEMEEPDNHQAQGKTHEFIEEYIPNGAPAPNLQPSPEVMDPPILPSISAKMKGKGKLVEEPLREPSHDSASVSATPVKIPRKRGPRKKLPENVMELGVVPASSAPPSVLGDATPVPSRPTSPMPANSNSIIFELDELPPPLKRAKKVDDATMNKRLKVLEDAQRKVWTTIAKKEVAKVYKYSTVGYQARQAQCKRIAHSASTQYRRSFNKSAKATKDIQAKSKRLMREMLVFWKKNEKEERDVRKRELREAKDRAIQEEEQREATRQARKLEFLISQTELYSHFVGSKLKTAEIQGESEADTAPAGAHIQDVEGAALQEIDFDDDDTTNIHRHARHNAQEAIALAKQRAQHFDTQAALERKTNEALALAKAQAHIRDDVEDDRSGSGKPLVDLDSDELNFQNPTSLTGPLTIKQPNMLMAQLKEYQLKGLNWLATLYEQGINGILADEMGLGKTVQSISLLAYLAETHDIWGPFLVVAPASTLHNWQQEITRFVPGLKALPYWGNVKDRATLRKFWSKKEISYNKDAPFHILVTSYQLVTQDQQYFQRVKWQYMILDEAQNIKNAASVRWRTLLGFHCRNRLLLTGTPIQNSMQELWALLHFIMPSLFDSHDEFNEWFSKDIENAAENKGSKLNEHQLRRLHMILKPFMLRRVKRHVQNELSDKIEIDIYVDLSARQRALYKGLLANVSVADLLEKAANIGDADSARSLMNLVMQFRKVCNHPELFERADVIAPFSFSNFGRSGPLNREGELLSLAYSTRNPIEYTIPQLFYEDGGLVDVPMERANSARHSGFLNKLMNIWSTDWLQKSLYDDVNESAFAFMRLLDMSPSEGHIIQAAPVMYQRLHAIAEDARTVEEAPYFADPAFVAHSASGISRFQLIPRLVRLEKAENLPDLRDISKSAWSQTCLSRPGLQWFIPPVVAPSITLHCEDRSFLERQTQYLDGPFESLALYGVPPQLAEREDAWSHYRSMVPGVATNGLITASSSDQLPLSTMQVPEAKRLIYDSAKLARLDALLQELKAGDHRVLVYFQMTRMMDLMEEYLIYRQYKYLRLDGSSKLEDRRDMVMDWQTRPDIFVFLLSTRAGGLGINLTAADTVVFYDHDWNPSNDSQAMDRAHRLGQTRQVTVYRLITKGTIDERIVQLARVKKDVQDIVVGNKNFQDVAKPSDIVQLLLNDEQIASLDASGGDSVSAKKAGKKAVRATGVEGEPTRDLWAEEGDDFFGSGGGPPAPADAGEEENAVAPPISTSNRGQRRKRGTNGTHRGRGRGRGRGSRGGKRAGASTGNATPAID